MKTTIKRMEMLQESLEELIAKREDQFDNCSEKWQESEKGEEFQEQTDRLQEMLDELVDWQAELGS